VIASQERRSRIETGLAVERVITDDEASGILRDQLNPHLQQGDFFGGLDETLDAPMALFQARKALKEVP
jgi:uncharacterized membrane protein YgcG